MASPGHSELTHCDLVTKLWELEFRRLNSEHRFFFSTFILVISHTSSSSKFIDVLVMGHCLMHCGICEMGLLEIAAAHGNRYPSGGRQLGVSTWKWQKIPFKLSYPLILQIRGHNNKIQTVINTAVYQNFRSFHQINTNFSNFVQKMIRKLWYLCQYLCQNLKKNHNRHVISGKKKKKNWNFITFGSPDVIMASLTHWPLGNLNEILDM